MIDLSVSADIVSGINAEIRAMCPDAETFDHVYVEVWSVMLPALRRDDALVCDTVDGTLRIGISDGLRGEIMAMARSVLGVTLN